MVNFVNSTFINNSGRKGGIVYSLNLMAKKNIKFIDCNFINNTANEGIY